MHFLPEHISEFIEKYEKVEYEYSLLLDRYLKISVGKEVRDEFLRHGFLRRLNTLRYCLRNIYTVCPPETIKPLDEGRRYDLMINLQCFLINLYGCFDCLAWAWVKHKDYPIKKNTDVGFYKLKDNYSADVKSHIDSMEDWFKQYLENYRHALAHRIPLYVPPYTVDPRIADKYADLDSKINSALANANLEEYATLSGQKQELENFTPLMTHSFGEKSKPIFFHAQILADWATIVSISSIFEAEFV